jgi:hypothetical protein
VVSGFIAVEKSYAPVPLLAASGLRLRRLPYPQPASFEYSGDAHATLH